MPKTTVSKARITLIGGPTALIDFAGGRFLTDPTFDEPGDYLGGVTLRKSRGAAVPVSEIGSVDAVLLSHDQHADNLDHSGRALLSQVPKTLTTPAGAARLGRGSQGLDPWQTFEMPTNTGSRILITATPARHGPPGIEKIAGDVTGFLLEEPESGGGIYITGDTVFFDGVAEVARRFKPFLILAFAGAARTRGPFNLTMSADDLLNLAAAFPDAAIVPLHTEGWEHFTQTADDLLQAFRFFSLSDRLKVILPGQTIEIGSKG
jgi:L-ascorbate metabolism protein UlaG (beta-lactamase superfamily)